MPYGRRRRRRKFRRVGLGKVKRDIKWLKKNIEFKHVDITTTDAACGTTSSNNLLNIVADGPLVSERSGEEITSRRIMCRGVVENDNGTPIDCLVRLILWRKPSAGGDNVGITNILTTENVNSMYNMDQKHNYKVYADETFAMDTSLHSLIPFKFVFKLNHTVKWSAATATESTLMTNGIYLTALGTSTAGANAPTYTMISRYSFCDS